MNRRVLVLGSSSLVGSHFVETFGRNYEVSAIGRRNIFPKRGVVSEFRKVDFMRKGDLQHAIRTSGADSVVNFAAETDVEKCELERSDFHGRVFITNSLAPRWIAEACHDSGKSLYQISTDAVFTGRSGPYSEDQRTGSCTRSMSWYGCTKKFAEAGVRTILKKPCIVRIAHPYRARFASKTDFARNLLDCYSKGNLYPLFADQTISPTLIDDVSLALDFLIKRDATGIFHVASSNATTPFDFGCKLISTFYDVRDPADVLEKGSVRDFNKKSGKAPRLVNGGLRTTKIAAAGFVPRTFEEGIEEIHRQSMRT